MHVSFPANSSSRYKFNVKNENKLNGKEKGKGIP